MRKYAVYFWAVLSFLSGAVFGGMRMEYSKPDENRFRDAIGSNITVSGIVNTEPAQKPGGQSFTMEVSGEGKIAINVSSGENPTISYGDEVSVRGTLKLPENFMTDQGSEFDYVSYLYKNNILYQLKNAKATVLSHGHGNWMVAKLIPVKNAIVDSFRRVLPGREADLLAGINLGVKSSIDDQFRNDLVTTGTIHIIALSGYNVTIVANFLHDFFVGILGLSIAAAAWSGALCIVLFVTMTGLQSSAVRAGIMALIGIFARSHGRIYDAFRALVIAGFLMILWDPKYLAYDVSFALSFLATLGILFITPVLTRAFARVPEKFLFVISLREAMSVTLGANLGVTPYILYKMGTFSLIALPANIMVLPAVPLAMGFGALAGLVGSFSGMLAYPFSIATYGLLRYVRILVAYFAKVPYASLAFHGFPLWLCLVMYLLLLWWLYRAWNNIRKENEIAEHKKSRMP
jgi:competence protein ComEC